MSDLLDSLFNQLAPPKEEVAEKPSKSLLERLWDSFDRPPSPTPVKPPVEAVKPSVAPLPNDPDGFWTNLKQKWHTEAPQRQAEITKIKQAEFGEGLNEAVMNLEKALSKKGLNGTIRSILRTEYRDLTGKDFDGRVKASPVKPISDAENILEGTELKTPRVLEAAGEFAQAAGEKVQDIALAAGAGVTTSSALATAGEMVADPLNLIPGGKGLAALGVLGAFKKSAHEIAIPLTKAEKSFVKEGAFGEQWNEFVKHEGIKWFDKPNFRVFGDELTYHPQDNAVVEKFFKWMADAPAGERKGIPPKFLSGRRETDAAIVGAESTVKPVYYHGTTAEFKEFDLEKGYKGMAFFTPDESFAKVYSKEEGRVIKANLDLKNPATYEEYKKVRKEVGTSNVAAALRAKGYDGVVDNKNPPLVIVFDKNQITQLKD